MLSLDQVGLKILYVEGSLTTGVKIELGGKLAFGLADSEGYHMVGFDLEALMDGLTVEAGWNDEKEKCKAIVKAEVDFVAIEVELIFSKNGPTTVEANAIDINNKAQDLIAKGEAWVKKYKEALEKPKALQIQHMVLMGNKWVPAPKLDDFTKRFQLMI